MTQVPLQGIGMRGLNRDTPSFAQDHTTFNSGLNMRPLNGSLQGVYAFDTNVEQAINGSGSARNIYGMTQWTQTGENKVNVAYMYSSDGSNLSFQVVEDLNGSDTSIQGQTANTPVDINELFDIDIFPFNDTLIINDGKNLPVYLRRSGSGDTATYTTLLVPGVPYTGATSVVSGQEYAVLATTVSGQTAPTWSSFMSSADIASGRSGTQTTPIVGTTFTATAAVSSVPAGFLVRPTPIGRLTTFNNRLIALNIDGEYFSTSEYGNASFLWSTPITQIGDLTGVTFQVSSTNSAGDDIITETPGQVLDAGQLGNYLIVYKSDSVFAVTDTGEPLYLVAEQIFNDDGILTPGCFVDIGNSRHFVVGTNGIYIHDGGVNKQNIAKGRVEDYFFDNLKNKDRTFVFHHQRDKEVWVCYHDGTSSVSGVNKALVYNYELDAWHERDLDPDTRGITATNLNGAYKVYRWGSDGVFELLATHVTGGDAQFDKHDLGDSTVTKRVHGVYPQTMGSIQVAVDSTEFLEATPALTDLRTFEPRTQYKMDYRLNGRYFDFRLAMLGTANPELTGITFDITPGGRR